MAMMMSACPISELHCIGCHQCICSGRCLAAHRDRYCCHNPSCRFHAPCPAPPEPDQQQTAETKAIEAPCPPDGNEAEGETSAAVAVGSSNLIRRDTITREWFHVGGTDATASTTPDLGTTSGADADQSSTEPARFTIEEYQAQAGLLAQYQPHQDRQRDGRTHGNNGGGPGAGGRPRITIHWD